MAVAVRAMQDGLARPDLRLVSAHVVLRRPGAVRPGHGRGRGAAQRSRRRAGRRPSCGSPATTAWRSRRTRCSASRTTSTRSTKKCSSPTCRRPSSATRRRRSPTSDDRPWGHINFHDQTDWRPASGIAPWLPEFTGGEGRMHSWVKLLKPPLLDDGTFDPVVLALFGDQIGSAVGQALGPRRPLLHAQPRDRHPLRAAAHHRVGAAGRRGLVRRRRLRQRPDPALGRRTATSAPIATQTANLRGRRGSTPRTPTAESGGGVGEALGLEPGDQLGGRLLRACGPPSPAAPRGRAAARTGRRRR